MNGTCGGFLTYVKANLKLASNDYGLACAMSMAMVICLSVLYLALLAIPALGAAVYFLYRGYRRLFFDSLYGNSAYLYQSLPVNPRQAVWGKIIASSLGVMLFNLVTVVLGLFVGIVSTGSVISLLGTFSDALAGTMGGQDVMPQQPGLLYLFTAVSMMVEWLATSALILLAVIGYQSIPGARQGGFSKALVIICAWGLSKIIDKLAGWGFDLLGLEHTMAMSVIGLVIKAAVLVLASWGSVRLLERHYRLG